MSICFWEVLKVRFKSSHATCHVSSSCTGWGMAVGVDSQTSRVWGRLLRAVVWGPHAGGPALMLFPSFPSKL